MEGIIQKWGNSNGIRLPKALMDMVLFKTNDRVDLIADDNKIIIKKSKAKPHLTLSERLKDFKGEYTFEEADWGKIEGNEI